MTPPKSRGLGRGLDALFNSPDGSPEHAGADRSDRRVMPVGWLRPGRHQPRRRFGEEGMRELAASVRERGLLQPILVRPDPDTADRFEIVAGERRWRAAQMARLHEVPVIVRDMDDGAALEVALVENVQRDNLSPMEEAEGYRRLQKEFSYTQETLARTVGRSRPHIANMLRLLSLPESARALVDEGLLSAGHARALLGTDDPDALAVRAVREGLSVRQVETLARDAVGRRRRMTAKDPNVADVERRLSEGLGLKVALASKGETGTLTLHYRTLEQLDELVRRLQT